MNINEFNRLTLDEKVIKCCHSKVLLTWETEIEIFELFYIDSFFAEAKFARESQSLVSIGQFTSLIGLDPYLNNLPLWNLY